MIDETSRLKDPSGKRARALLKVSERFRTRWGLTGTPRPNSSQDLFMPAAIITDGALWGRAFVPWQKRHFRPRDPFGRDWAALPGAEEQIAADFGTIAMTVADDDMPDLPPLNIVVTRVELPDAVMATYKTLQRELFAALEARTIEASSPLVATGKCAQLANGFLYGDGNEDPVEVHTVKIDWLRELVESLDGEPLLIAYEFIEDLRTIRRAFGEVPALGGLTPGGRGKAAGRGLERRRAAVAGLSSRLGRTRAQSAARRGAHGVAVAELVGRTNRAGDRAALPARTGAARDDSRLHRRRHRRRDEARSRARQDERAGRLQATSGAGLMQETAPARLAGKHRGEKGSDTMTKYRVTFMETHKIEVEAADERAAVSAAVDAKDKAFDDNRDESDDDIEVELVLRRAPGRGARRRPGRLTERRDPRSIERGPRGY